MILKIKKKFSEIIMFLFQVKKERTVIIILKYFLVTLVINIIVIFSDDRVDSITNLRLFFSAIN